MSKKKLPANQSTLTNNGRIDELYSRLTSHIEIARSTVQRTVDTEMVKAYWNIGRDIVMEEQAGEPEAEYGTFLLQEISERLTAKFGKGFSVSTLKAVRRFFLVYQDVTCKKAIGHAVRTQSIEPEFNQDLSWTHYRALMRVSRKEARLFYEREAAENNWSARELERQIGSLLFDRLAKSKDKQGLLDLAHKGQEINKPEDAIKEPVVLEFLGIPESHRLVESKLEEALIGNLQAFLLELGKGFAFVARQKRLTLDGKHFYADLVFYHTILKCYIIIDIKTHELNHGDLGQMLLYVNYYDQECTTEEDNPTIGLVLCSEKSDAVVKYTLGDKAKQIFASKYQFHLPTEEELEKELKREIKAIRHQLKQDDSSDE